MDDLSIDQFSKHLFWDVDRNQLNIVINKAYIIKQVLEYGMLHDWILIQKHYGIEQIAETAKTFRELDKKSPFIHHITFTQTQTRFQMLYPAAIDNPTLGLTLSA